MKKCGSNMRKISAYQMRVLDKNGKLVYEFDEPVEVTVDGCKKVITATGKANNKKPKTD
ncbi:hypothetical protein [Anaerovirgula multivorans]|uniref:hypothetical protein n=1 Tax=Anaerovirgula multivorans TaxID=312168 RepID=UPI001595945B|nr:hypothetical protein [Anaerovirgula multivorans]